MYESGYVVGDVIGNGSGSTVDASPHAFIEIANRINDGSIVLKDFFIEFDCIKAELFLRVSAGVS